MRPQLCHRVQHQPHQLIPKSGKPFDMHARPPRSMARAVDRVPPSIGVNKNGRIDPAGPLQPIVR